MRKRGPTGSARGTTPPNGPESEPPPPPAIPVSARRNLSVLLAAAPIAVATARVVGFSRGDQALLTTLLQTLDVPAVLIGSLIPAAVIVLGITIYAAIGDPRVSRALLRGWRGLSPLTETGIAAALLLLVYVSDLQTLGATVGLLVLAGAIRALLTRRARSRGRSWVGFGGDTVAVVAALLLPVLMNASMWLPSERVRLADGLQEQVYVLAVDGPWTTLLRTKDRRIIRLPSADVTEREVCNTTQVRALAQEFGTGSPQPQCSQPK